MDDVRDEVKDFEALPTSLNLAVYTSGVDSGAVAESGSDRTVVILRNLQYVSVPRFLIFYDISVLYWYGTDLLLDLPYHRSK